MRFSGVVVAGNERGKRKGRVPLSATQASTDGAASSHIDSNSSGSRSRRSAKRVRPAVDNDVVFLEPDDPEIVAASRGGVAGEGRGAQVAVKPEYK